MTVSPLPGAPSWGCLLDHCITRMTTHLKELIMKRGGVHSQGFIILQVDEIKDDVCIMDEENMSIVSFPRRRESTSSTCKKVEKHMEK